MSGAGSPKDQPVDCSDLRVAVVAASWHEQVMDGLVAGAQEAIKAYRVAHLRRRPRSRLLRAAGRRAGLCARRGTTPSSRSAWSSAAAPRTSTTSAAPPPTGSTGCRSTAAVPIGFGLLTCDTEEQALDRAGLRAAARARATRPRPPRFSPHRPCAGSAPTTTSAEPCRLLPPSPRSRSAPGCSRPARDGRRRRAGPARLRGVDHPVRAPVVPHPAVRAGQPVLLWVSGGDARLPVRDPRARAHDGSGPRRGRGRSGDAGATSGSTRWCRARSCWRTRCWRPRGAADAGRQQPVVPRPRRIRRAVRELPAGRPRDRPGRDRPPADPRAP